MIKWNSNFQIEESMIQLAEAYVEIESFDNIGDTCEINVIISDESKENIAKRQTHVVNTNCQSLADAYDKLLSEYPDSELV